MSFVAYGFLVLLQEEIPSRSNPKYLDLSLQGDLDLWDCLEEQ